MYRDESLTLSCSLQQASGQGHLHLLAFGLKRLQAGPPQQLLAGGDEAAAAVSVQGQGLPASAGPKREYGAPADSSVQAAAGVQQPAAPQVRCCVLITSC